MAHVVNPPKICRLANENGRRHGAVADTVGPASTLVWLCVYQGILVAGGLHPLLLLMIWSDVVDVGHVSRRGLHDSAGGPAIVRTIYLISVGRCALSTSLFYNSGRCSLHSCVSLPMASRYRPVFLRLTVPADAIGPAFFAVARWNQVLEQCALRQLRAALAALGPS